MSHLAPQAAIFSPSIARAAASTAKDWAYVDGWLRRQFATQQQRDPSTNTNTNTTTASSKPPSFERNPETLEILLSLIAANEEADEEHDRLARLEAAALDEVRAAEAEKLARRQHQQEHRQQQNASREEEVLVYGDLAADDLLEAIDSNLSKDGQAALDALADVAQALGLSPTLFESEAHLAHRFVELQGRLYEVEHLLHRGGMLDTYIASETAKLGVLIEELRNGAEYRLPTTTTSTSTSTTTSTSTSADTTHTTNENDPSILTARISTLTTLLPQLHQQVQSLSQLVGGPPPLTVGDLKADEEAYVDLLAKKKDLDAQVKAFAGLPPDVEAARVELERLRVQLREATERRDADFEMLVERESPVKHRRQNSRRF
ncbi:hypothetical protein F4777DRAFT_183284 [Nemania sp. FL0916]|nr:hypothetical protein F4777DRAFT_183284 [Nemania sp. FL0916]